MSSVKAWVIREPGAAEQLRLEEVPPPTAKLGWVKIRIRAFGLNRSEWFTRRGDSPSVVFPRVLGIECVGEVLDAGGTDLKVGSRVAAMMGGMGRQFDGSYAELTLVPRACVFELFDGLSWDRLAALPEMLQTTHGSLHKGLQIDAARSLLIRGGTSSIGLAALALSKAKGLRVGVTTRSGRKRGQLEAAGADEVWVDDGQLADRVRSSGVVYDRVLELIGTTTLLDSLHCVSAGGIVCMTGILGGKWTLDGFEPLVDIPSGVKLTAYSGEAADLGQAELTRYVELVETGKLRVPAGPVFDFEQLIDAHRLMDRDEAGGKIVVKGIA